MLPLEVFIESVDCAAADPSLIARFGMDSPRQGPYAQDQYIVVAGWVLAREGVSVRCIEVRQGGQLVKRARVNVPRPDVLATHGQSSAAATDRIGFHFEVGAVGLAASADLEIQAICYRAAVRDEVSVRLCMVTVAKASNLDLRPIFQPIQVTAIGRSGTTLLMQMLGQHPEILVTNFYPYELRQAAYWMHFLKVASAPADFESSAHPDEFESDRCHVGHNPYSHPEYINQYKDPQAARSYYTAATFSALAAMCVGRIDDYYRFVAQQEKKPAAHLFAEKFVPGTLQNVCKDLYMDPKEIILTRDFRDMLCSAKSFNLKRNNLSFGRDKVNDDFEWVDRISRLGARRMYEAWRERGDAALLVRYEDLVTRPAEEVRRICEYLGVAFGKELVDAVVTALFSPDVNRSQHRTTSSAQASVGRWRTDMPRKLQEHCNQQLGYALAAFGYV